MTEQQAREMLERARRPLRGEAERDPWIDREVERLRKIGVINGADTHADSEAGRADAGRGGVV